MTDKGRKATSIDIAYRAGVSQSTVSRALSGSPLVNDETRQKIEAIAKELNYKVDKNARNLRTQSTHTLALLIFEDPTSDDSHINPFFLSILGSITRAAANRQYDLLVSFQQSSEDWYSDFEKANRADGMILLGYGDYQSAKHKMEKLTEAGAHFVLWGPVGDDLPGRSIGCDNTHGTIVATEHILKLGRKKLAFVGTADESAPEFMARYQGFTQALDEAGQKPVVQIDCENTENDAIDACSQLLAGYDVDGILCASDTIAIGVIKACQSSGKRVPLDISVIGFDDIASAAYMTPSLTTVRQDAILAGEMLVEELLKSINGEEPGPNVMLPELIIRESCQ